MSADVDPLARPGRLATARLDLAEGGGDLLPRAQPMLRALRPKQWVKNLLVIAAPGAAGVLGHPGVLAHTALALVAFCAASSAMYLVNDVADAPADRLHPRKRSRPVASGAVSVRAALAAAAALIVLAVAVGASVGWPFLAALGGYVALVTTYSVWLRRVAILDVAAVAAGFVLRAVAGGLATHVQVSEWFLILVSAGSVFVVAGKRQRDYADLVEVGSDAPGPVAPPGRPVEYTPFFLRYLWMMASAVAISGYCLWAFVGPEDPRGFGFREISAIPFVLAILRYALLLDAGHGGAPEEVFLGDRQLQVLSLIWVVVYALGVYVGH